MHSELLISASLTKDQEQPMGLLVSISILTIELVLTNNSFSPP